MVEAPKTPPGVDTKTIPQQREPKPISINPKDRPKKQWTTFTAASEPKEPDDDEDDD